MSGYIGPIPVPQGIQKKESFTATASQTTFNTTGYTDGAFINVYLNGVRLINGTDYTATNGSDIVLTTGASASDVLDFETFNSFSLVNQTFTGDVTVGDDLLLNSDSAVLSIGADADLKITHDGTNGDFESAGDLTFDVAGDIILDADGNQVHFKDNGTEIGVFQNSSSDFLIESRVQDKDILLAGNDSGSNVTALKLDMSDAGTAIFNHDIFLAANGNVGVNVSNAIQFTSGSEAIVTLGGSEIARFLDTGGITFNGDTADAQALDDYDEGTWTPSSPDVTLTGIQTSTYTKIGRMVFVQAKFTFPTSSSSTQAKVDGLPFTVDGNGTNSQYNLSAGEHTFGSYITCPAIPSNRIVFRPNGGTSATYAQVSGKTFRLSGWYET